MTKLCDGSLYVYTVLDGDKLADFFQPMLRGMYKVNFYMDEKLVGSKEFSLAQ